MNQEDDNKVFYKDLSYKVVGVLYEVYNELGYGYQEKIYEKAIAKSLLENGINYTEKGSVEVSVAEKVKNGKKFAVLICKDSGVGLTDKDEKNIMTRFYRGDRVIGMHPNASGLGLFIITGIIKPSGGFLDFDSPGKGKGSVFRIWMPLKQ